MLYAYQPGYAYIQYAYIQVLLYTYNKSEEEVIDKAKELEMLGSLDNVTESVIAIYKQLKKTALKV